MEKYPFQSSSPTNKAKGLKVERPSELSKEIGGHERWWCVFLNQTLEKIKTQCNLLIFLAISHSITV